MNNLLKLFAITILLAISSTNSFAEGWDRTQFEAKYPYELANNYAIAASIGNLAIQNFQLAFNSGSEAKVFAEHYLVASGCKPGLCTILDKLIVVDLRVKNAIVLFEPFSDFQDRSKKGVRMQPSDEWYENNSGDFSEWAPEVRAAVEAWASNL